MSRHLHILHDVSDVVECDLSAVDLRVISDQER